MRRSGARVAIVAALLAGACDPGTVERDLRLDPVLPPGDERAREELAALRYEVWPASVGICAELVSWASSCGEECPPAPGQEGGAIASVTLTKGEDGSWSSEVLPLPATPDEVEVVVRGEDERSTRFLHGCVAVDFAEDGVVVPVRLARAWCAEDTCESCFEVDCDAQPVEPGSDPVCRALDCGVDGRCCEGRCVSIADDPDHCGDCGIVCPVDAPCQDGTCAPCDLFCAFLNGDSCDREQGCRCGEGPRCMGGFCCDGSCRNNQSDPDYCGSCVNACTEGQTCTNGICT